MVLVADGFDKGIYGCTLGQVERYPGFFCRVAAFDQVGDIAIDGVAAAHKKEGDHQRDSRCQYWYCSSMVYCCRALICKSHSRQ